MISCDSREIVRNVKPIRTLRHRLFNDVVPSIILKVDLLSGAWMELLSDKSFERWFQRYLTEQVLFPVVSSCHVMSCYLFRPVRQDGVYARRRDSVERKGCALSWPDEEDHLCFSQVSVWFLRVHSLSDCCTVLRSISFLRRICCVVFFPLFSFHYSYMIDEFIN